MDGPAVSMTVAAESPSGDVTAVDEQGNPIATDQPPAETAKLPVLKDAPPASSDGVTADVPLFGPTPMATMEPAPLGPPPELATPEGAGEDEEAKEKAAAEAAKREKEEEEKRAEAPSGGTPSGGAAKAPVSGKAAKKQASDLDNIASDITGALK